MINILIADKLSPLAISELEKLGANITNEPTLAAEELPSRISGFEVLVVRSTKVTSATIAAGKDDDGVKVLLDVGHDEAKNVV